MLDMILLVIATCCDSFFMSIAYGVEKIKIPSKAILMIAFCGTFFLGVSLFMANLLTTILPPSLGVYISFTILFLLGITNLFQIQVKHYVNKHKNKPLIIKFKGISFVVDIFLDEKEADMDHSKELSIKESMYLGIALSIDSLASGLAYGIGTSDVSYLLISSLLFGIFIIYFGNFIGKNISSYVHFDISWISGCILIILAFMRL